MMIRLLLGAFTIWAASLAATAQTPNYQMTLVETGQRDYYCTTTIRLQNDSDEILNDLNGSLVLLVGEDEVGQSRPSSLFNISPGQSSDQVFETPNAPCDEVTGYRFSVNACRFGGSFREPADCVERVVNGTGIEATTSP